MAEEAAPPEFLRAVETQDAKIQALLAPGVYAYGAVRPMGRIRAYTTAGLSPFASRGAPSEFHLVGHIHLDAQGLVARVEGFNGGEGERWAKQAYDKLGKSGSLAQGSVLQAMTPLRACTHTGIR